MYVDTVKRGLSKIVIIEAQHVHSKITIKCDPKITVFKCYITYKFKLMF